MCLLHLDDATTYEPVDQYFPGLVAGRLRNLLKTHGKLLHTWQKTSTRYTLTPLAKSLLQLEKSPSLRVLIFYCVPKIHKTLINPPGRPIVSSCSTATYYASVYLDNKRTPTNSPSSFHCLQFLSNIPTLSEHSPSLFDNFVLQEIIRYRIACSNDEDYADISTSFASRLEARGYNPSIITNSLMRVPPRTDLMSKIMDSQDAPVKKFTKGNPIISLCVPRLTAN